MSGKKGNLTYPRTYGPIHRLKFICDISVSKNVEEALGQSILEDGDAEGLSSEELELRKKALEVCNNRHALCKR